MSVKFYRATPAKNGPQASIADVLTLVAILLVTAILASIASESFFEARAHIRLTKEQAAHMDTLRQEKESIAR
jgi:hypothetical protein